MFEAVGDRLRENGLTGGKEVRNKYGALLRGLLHCDPCNVAMVHTYTVKNGRRYRYYVCATAQQRGWDSCPSKSLPAQQIEDSVIERVRELARNPQIIAETIRQAREMAEVNSCELRAELNAAERELRRLNGDLAKVAATTGNGMRVDRLADLQDRIGSIERRISEIRAGLAAVEAEAVSEDDLQQALRTFDPVWKSLNTNEQTRIVRTVIERVGYDGRTGKVAVMFRSAGFKALCEGRRDAMASNLVLEYSLTPKRRGRRPVEKEEAGHTGKLPRITRLMALAIKFDGLIRDGVVRDYANLARLGHVTRARMTQVMNMLNLAPDIQQEILFLPQTTTGRDPISERALRRVTAVVRWDRQRKVWREICRAHL